MAARVFANLLAGVFALCLVLVHGHAEPNEFMELSVHSAQGGREPRRGEPHQAVKSQFTRTGIGVFGSTAENPTTQLMLGGGLMILFFICIFVMQETEDFDPKPKQSPKRASPQGSPVASPRPSVGNLPFPGETTLLLDDIHRQEEALKRQEEEAWRRQEEAVRIEKEALLRREDEIRARYERMEALHPKPALYIPGASPAPPATMPAQSYAASQSFESFDRTAPRSSPLLFEPYAAREARERREALEAAEQALVESSPTLAWSPSREALEAAEQALVASSPAVGQRRPATPGSPPKNWSPPKTWSPPATWTASEAAEVESGQAPSQRRPAELGSPPKTWEPPASYAALASPNSSQTDTRELRAFQAQWETYEQVRRDTDALADSIAREAPSASLTSPVPPATAPVLSSPPAFAFPTSPASPSAFSAKPATAPDPGDEGMTPEQRATLQSIMQSTGASREATIRAMKKAREDEEAILKELEARRRRAAAP